MESIFKFPSDLLEASRDGRLWNCCPSKVSYSAACKQIIVDYYIEEDHPRPAVAERYVFSAPDYKISITESLREVSNSQPN